MTKLDELITDLIVAVQDTERMNPVVGNFSTGVKSRQIDAARRLRLAASKLEEERDGARKRADAANELGAIQARRADDAEAALNRTENERDDAEAKANAEWSRAEAAEAKLAELRGALEVVRGCPYTELCPQCLAKIGRALDDEPQAEPDARPGTHTNPHAWGSLAGRAEAAEAKLADLRLVARDVVRSERVYESHDGDRICDVSEYALADLRAVLDAEPQAEPPDPLYRARIPEGEAQVFDRMLTPDEVASVAWTGRVDAEPQAERYPNARSLVEAAKRLGRATGWSTAEFAAETRRTMDAWEPRAIPGWRTTGSGRRTRRTGGER